MLNAKHNSDIYAQFISVLLATSLVIQLWSLLSLFLNLQKTTSKYFGESFKGVEKTSFSDQEVTCRHTEDIWIELEHKERRSYND